MVGHRPNGVQGRGEAQRAACGGGCRAPGDSGQGGLTSGLRAQARSERIEKGRGNGATALNAGAFSSSLPLRGKDRRAIVESQERGSVFGKWADRHEGEVEDWTQSGEGTAAERRAEVGEVHRRRLVPPEWPAPDGGPG